MRGRSGCDEPVPAPRTSRSASAASAPSTAVSFDVEQGEVFSIIGPNGAGKTTIFNLISRIYAADLGRLIFEDQDITDAAAAPHRRPRHRAHLPEHRAVRQRDAAAEPADRPALPLARRRPVAARFLPSRPARGAAASGEGRGRDRLPRPAALPRHADRQPAVRRAQGRRTRPRAVHRAEAAAARRAVLRPECRGDRGHGLLDRGHQEGPRHHRDHGRARHEPGAARCPTG